MTAPLGERKGTHRRFFVLKPVKRSTSLLKRGSVYGSTMLSDSLWENTHPAMPLSHGDADLMKIQTHPIREKKAPRFRNLPERWLRVPRSSRMELPE